MITYILIAHLTLWSGNTLDGLVYKEFKTLPECHSEAIKIDKLAKNNGFRGIWYDCFKVKEVKL